MAVVVLEVHPLAHRCSPLRLVRQWSPTWEPRRRHRRRPKHYPCGLVESQLSWRKSLLLAGMGEWDEEYGGTLSRCGTMVQRAVGLTNE
jgi:hypothetical protein